MTRVFIVHGWGDKPGDHWMPWLKGQLELNGFTVAAPAMPYTEAPVIGAWTSHLNREVGKTGEAAYYVGHSIGCQTIIRHLEQLPGARRLLGYGTSDALPPSPRWSHGWHRFAPSRGETAT